MGGGKLQTSERRGWIVDGELKRASLVVDLYFTKYSNGPE